MDTGTTRLDSASAKVDGCAPRIRDEDEVSITMMLTMMLTNKDLRHLQRPSSVSRAKSGQILGGSKNRPAGHISACFDSVIEAAPTSQRCHSRLLRCSLDRDHLESFVIARGWTLRSAFHFDWAQEQLSVHRWRC